MWFGAWACAVEPSVAPHETDTVPVEDTSAEDTGADHGPSLAVDRAAFVVGERVIVTFDGAAGTATDWVGLYPASQLEHEGSTQWLYTGGTQSPGALGVLTGEVRFLPIALPAGAWEARLFPEDTYDVQARAAFTVVEPGQVEPPAPVGDLTVMTFNSWLDGSAVPDGVSKIAAAVVAADPDLVAFQEGGPTFAAQVRAALADADPAWASAAAVHDGSDNVIVSRLPILSTSGDLGGYWVRADVELPSGAALAVVGVHFDYQEYGPYAARDGATAAQIEQREEGVRGDDASRVVAELATAGAALVLGDHNAPSHLDWTAANADQDFGLVVDWPTSRAFTDAAFVDTYRAVHPDPTTDRGLTWSPGYPAGTLDAGDVHDRIDFVYARDGAVTLVPLQAYVYAADPWPSDHRAVVVSFAVD